MFDDQVVANGIEWIFVSASGIGLRQALLEFEIKTLKRRACAAWISPTWPARRAEYSAAEETTNRIDSFAIFIGNQHPTALWHPRVERVTFYAPNRFAGFSSRSREVN